MENRLICLMFCYTIDIIWNKSKSVFVNVFITLQIKGG